MDAPPLKLLFVCSRNRVRSLTAERLLDGVPGYAARSVGTQPGARIVLNEGHLGWADLIVVMEKSHLRRIRQKYPEALDGKRVVTLHLPDEYTYMATDLVEELVARLSPHVVWPERFEPQHQHFEPPKGVGFEPQGEPFEPQLRFDRKGL